MGGSALGGMLGMPAAGATAGQGLGAAISKWIGAGDYSVSKNSIVQRAANSIPMMHNNGQSVVIRHREFIGAINGSVGFTVQQSLNLNPGLAATFPWLAQIASRFQEYEFKGVVFHYVPTSGTFNGSSAALGSVMFQTTYRSTDVAPTTKAEMMNEYWATEVVPFDTCAHPIECDPKENPFSVHYVRNQAITSGEPLMYDLGKTFIATQGMADTSIVGDLWVTYEVELKKPLISSPVVASSTYYAAAFNAQTTSSFFTNVTSSQGSLAITYPTAKTVQIPAGTGGYVLVTCTIRGTGLTHATQVSWDAAVTATNWTSWKFDTITSSLVTTITGTNPSTNQLTYQLGGYLTDTSAVATLLFPNAQWSGGSTTYGAIEVTVVPQ